VLDLQLVSVVQTEAGVAVAHLTGSFALVGAGFYEVAEHAVKVVSA
jgi:hypothetical protein